MDFFTFYEHESIPYDNCRLFNNIHTRERLKSILSKIWNERNQYGITRAHSSNDSDDWTEQQFFTFYESFAKVGKYTGVIKYENVTVQVLPKIFESPHYCKEETIVASNAHLLWWLSFSNKIHVPKSSSTWDLFELNLPDILIFFFASLARDELIFNKHQTYVEQEESLLTIRGRINFNRYAINYYLANPHIVPCLFSSLEINNLFNQIVKFTSKKLFHHTENPDIKKLLSEIMWILDDVEDIFLSEADCDKVKIPPLNVNMKIIIDYCRLFLSGLTIKTSEDNLEIFAFLLPMEKLFEDFIYGFIKEKFEFRENVLTVSSKGYYGNEFEKWLATEKTNEKLKNVFAIMPDIYIKRTNGDLILDTKYKKIYTREEAGESERRKSGASIDDVYQMIAYAIKYNINNIHLLYPEKADTDSGTISAQYIVCDRLGGSENEISIWYHRLPVICKSIQKFGNTSFNIKEIFREQEKELYNELRTIILS